MYSLQTPSKKKTVFCNQFSRILFQQISVKTEEGVTYEFPCYRWLASNEGDGKLQRDLIPSLTFTDDENDLGET